MRQQVSGGERTEVCVFADIHCSSLNGGTGFVGTRNCRRDERNRAENDSRHLANERYALKRLNCMYKIPGGIRNSLLSLCLRPCPVPPLRCAVLFTVQRQHRKINRMRHIMSPHTGKFSSIAAVLRFIASSSTQPQ